MYCGSCGKEIKDDAKFCPKCGAIQTPKSYTPPSFPSEGNMAIKRKLPVIAIAIVLVLIALIVGCCMSRSKNGMKSENDAAGAYLVACYEQDADTIISLVPDEILEEIMEQYDCSKKQLKQAVEDELPYESENYYHCGSVKGYEKSSSVDKDEYSDHVDRRVEDCMDLDKISKMKFCWVNVEDDYYYNNIPVYQYGKDKNTWYNMEATNFVAYAVWEEY